MFPRSLRQDHDQRFEITIGEARQPSKLGTPEFAARLVQHLLGLSGPDAATNQRQ
jgi:hypothetical protein